MLDLLLIVPPSASKPATNSRKPILHSPTLGVGYLAAVLEQAGYKVAILDMWAEGLRGKELVEFLIQNKPRVVGISTIVTTFKNGLKVAQITKDTLPYVPVIVGGPHASFQVDETLACAAVDIVVRFEGEITLLEVMRFYNGESINLNEIKGIAYRDGDQIHLTERRPLIQDLNRLPLPAHHLIDPTSYSLPTVITARGCPHQCVFCAARTIYEEFPYRARSPESVVSEIIDLSTRFKGRDLFIADDTLTLHEKRAHKICDLLDENKVDTPWRCEARVNTMSPELASHMRNSGCHLIQYGVETGDPEMMKLIRKGITLEQVEHVVDYTLAAGLDVMCSLIIGFPWDTHETIRKTLNFGQKIMKMAEPWRVSKPEFKGSRTKKRGCIGLGLAILTPLPGTYVYDQADQLGMRFLTRDWDRFTFTEPVIETQHLSAAELRKYYIESRRNLS